MAILTYSCDQLAYQALRDLGCIRTGQGAPPDLLTDILVAANQLIDDWLIDNLMIYAFLADIYSLSGSSQSYTIGPSGADFTAPRPTDIQDANILLNTVSPVVRQPVKIINVDQWANIRVRNIQPAIPLVLYYDRGFDATLGYGTINLWPGPQANYQLEIFTPKQLTEFPDQTTAIRFPPAYANAIRKCLAVSIAPMMALYAKFNNHFTSPLATLPLIEKQANRAKAGLMASNTKMNVMNLDPAFSGMQSGSDWNYLLGTTGGQNR